MFGHMMARMPKRSAAAPRHASIHHDFFKSSFTTFSFQGSECEK
jgi:hypothetical protein